MILDSLENSKRTECIHPLFKQAFDYVKSNNFSKMDEIYFEIRCPSLQFKSIYHHIIQMKRKDETLVKIAFLFTELVNAYEFRDNKDISYLILDTDNYKCDDDDFLNLLESDYPNLYKNFSSIHHIL